MMFGRNKLKSEIDLLKEQMETLRADKDLEIAQLQAENRQQQSELAAVQQQSYEEADVLACLLLGGELLSTIREGLADSANSLHNEQDALSQLEHIFSQTHDALERLEQRAQTINTEASSSMEEATELDKTAESINGLVSSIQEISDQTNLLALNAAIEAARAGDAGRGFSVVADEVRTLASKAHSSSSEIDRLINLVLNRTAEIKKMIGSNQNSAADISASSNQISAVVADVLKFSEHMKQVITIATARSFLDTVKLDHAVWKNQVYNFVNTKDFDAVVNAHTECRLGKWYFEGEGKTKYGSMPSFKSLDAPHKKVHESGRLAITAGREGNTESMTKHLHNMELASQSVVHIIDRLFDEILQENSYQHSAEELHVPETMAEAIAY